MRPQPVIRAFFDEPTNTVSYVVADPVTKQAAVIDPVLDYDPIFQRMKAMAKQRSHSIEFKRQVAQEFVAGETLYALAKRYDVSRNLIRVWVKKLETGVFDDDANAANLC